MRTLIADDERLARQRLLTFLQEEPDLSVAGECATAPEVIEFLRRDPVDLLLLDIQMPGMDAFEMLQQLAGQPLPLIIFVTAYDQFALRAFEVNAVDYLLKPFDQARLRLALAKARQQLDRDQRDDQQERLLSLLETLQGRQQTRDRFAIKNDGRIFFVRADQVDWIEAEHNYVRLHVGGESYLLRERMTVLEGELDRRKFRRIHRSTIVNIDRIKELQSWFRGDYVVVLHDGRKLTMSRTYREQLRDLLD